MELDELIALAADPKRVAALDVRLNRVPVVGKPKRTVAVMENERRECAAFDPLRSNVDRRLRLARAARGELSVQFGPMTWACRPLVRPMMRGLGRQ